MAYPVRSLAEISERVRQAFRQYLPGTDATIAQNVLYVFSKTQALLLKEIDLRLEHLYRQLFASTADEDHLERRHAAEFGLMRAAASFASGTLSVTGTPDAVLPAGLVFLSAGVTYRSTAQVTLSGGGTGAMPVRALQPGPRGNRFAGEEMALANPALTPALSPVATVTALAGGAEREDIESLRARILDRKRRPPQGGAESDYEQWARANANVTQAWARRLTNGPGAVGVWFLGVGGAIPDPAEVAALKADLEARRMIGVRDLQINAPVASPLGVTIEIEPDTVELRAAVTAAIAAVIVARRRPGLPGDNFLFSRSWLTEAVADVVGEDANRIVLPSTDLEYGLGSIPVPGVVSFV